MAKGRRKGYKQNHCNVGTDHKRLRISIPSKLFNGKRKYLFTGLNDTIPNRARVQQVADLMNGDILRGEFDFSLERYKGMITPTGIAESNQDSYQGQIPGVHYQMLAVIWGEWIGTLNLSEETYNNHSYY